jgi:hypothetical protein
MLANRTRGELGKNSLADPSLNRSSGNIAQLNLNARLRSASITDVRENWSPEVEDFYELSRKIDAV